MFREHLESDLAMRNSTWALSGLRLVCHCTLGQECHGGFLIDEYRRQFPETIYRPSLPVEQYSITCLDCEKNLKCLKVPQQTEEFM